MSVMRGSTTLCLAEAVTVLASNIVNIKYTEGQKYFRMIYKVMNLKPLSSSTSSTDDAQFKTLRSTTEPLNW